MNTLTDIVAIITSFLLLFFATFLFFHKKGNVLSNKLLSLFFFVNAVFMIDYLQSIHFRAEYYSSYFYLFYFGEISAFVFGPSLYLYTCSVAYQNFKLEKSDVLHFIPALLFIFLLLLKFIFFSKETALRINLLDNIFTYEERFIKDLFFNVQVFGYLIFSLLVLKKYRIEIKKFFSSVEKMNLYWLEVILFGFILMWLVDLATEFLLWQKLLPNYAIRIFVLISISTNFLVATVLIYWGLKKPEILIGIESEHKAKVVRHLLSDDEKQKYLQRLSEFMENEKPYFDPSLTIADLSQRVKIAQRNLSYCNQQFISSKLF